MPARRRIFYQAFCILAAPFVASPLVAQPTGATPYGGVIRDSSGNLYGTGYDGGASGFGVVYAVSPSGQETVLHSFSGYPKDGESPYGGVVLDSSDNLYGTTYYGGAHGDGAVFKIDTAG